MAVKPLLIVAWGNRSRGDDAVGPLFLDALRRALDPEALARVDLLEEHQLHPELALDLVGRERVLLADADPEAPAPYALHAVQPGRDASLSSHALSPAALLAVYRELHGQKPPPVTLLGLHAQSFGLGRPVSAAAEAALPAAVLWALAWIDGDAPGTLNA
ncbi:MAG: hydrogenase maturation protease [Rubrivivax sp.]|jgi:hydrogenase maturation protease|nr:hydrogenase maturation protease [Rubrivivax sp.]